MQRILSVNDQNQTKNISQYKIINQLGTHHDNDEVQVLDIIYGSQFFSCESHYS